MFMVIARHEAIFDLVPMLCVGIQPGTICITTHMYRMYSSRAMQEQLPRSVVTRKKYLTFFFAYMDVGKGREQDAEALRILHPLRLNVFECFHSLSRM